MKKRVLLAVLLVILSFGGLAGIKALQIMAMIEAGENMGPFPETVEVRASARDQWEQALTAIGTVTPIRGAMVRSEAEGVVRETLFDPGAEVAAGTVLVRLDAAVEQAQLAEAQATLELTVANLGRIRELHARRNVSDSELDRAEAEHLRAQATVANLQAQLDKRTVVAPFSGRLGIRQLSVGDYVTKGQNIVTLQDYKQVFVDLELPQNKISQLSPGMEVRVVTDAYPDEVFTGKLTAFDPDIDPVTRSMALQATFDNPQGKLLPGMYVKVSVILPQPREVVIIPRSAVLHANYGDTVFVVDGKDESGLEKVRQQVVRLGESRGDFVEITRGLDGSEEVVTAGAFKLRDGSLITRSNTGTLEPQLNPTPTEG